MSNCQDGRFNCGPTLASACVPYSGQQLQNVDINSLPCQPNINDIIQGLDSVISTIKTGLDLTQLNGGNLTLPNPDAVNSLFQLVLNQLNSINTQLSQLQTQVNAIDIVNQQISIDLSCIFGGANCNPTNQYTLLYILNVFLQQICNLKAQINQ